MLTEYDKSFFSTISLTRLIFSLKKVMKKVMARPGLGGWSVGHQKDYYRHSSESKLIAFLFPFRLSPYAPYVKFLLVASAAAKGPSICHIGWKMTRLCLFCSWIGELKVLFLPKYCIKCNAEIPTLSVKAYHLSSKINFLPPEPCILRDIWSIRESQCLSP